MLLEGEEASEFESLYLELRKDWQPAGIRDDLDVERLAHLHWNRRRCYIAVAAIISRSPGFVGALGNSDLPFQHLLRVHLGDGSTPVSPKAALLECALEKLRKLCRKLAASEFDFLEAMTTLDNIYGDIQNSDAAIPYQKMVELLIKRCACETRDAKSADATDYAREMIDLIVAEAERFRQLRDAERSKDVIHTSLASMIPSQHDLDRIIRYESHLGREIDGKKTDSNDDNANDALGHPRLAWSWNPERSAR